MTTLAVDTPRAFEASELESYQDYGIIASDTIYEGAAVGDNGAGNARPLVAGDEFLGFAERQVANESGSASAKQVRIRTSGHVKLTVTGAAAITDRGKVVYATDDATFTLVPGGTRIGRVVRWVTSTTCIVAFGAAEVILNAGRRAVLFTNETNSAALTASSTETAFDTGSKTIKGGELQAGDILRVKLSGTATATNSTDTLKVRLFCATEVVCDTGAVDVADGDIFVIEADIHVETAGASGKLRAQGFTMIGTGGTATARPFRLASASEDLSGDVAITAKGTWSTTSGSNSCRLELMSVERL